MYMQLGMLIYIMKVRPMDKWYYNAFVMFNEYMLMMTSVCAFLFTGFVSTGDPQCCSGNNLVNFHSHMEISKNFSSAISAYTFPK